jgi:hypothetical protein
MQVSEDLSERLRGFAVYHLKMRSDKLVKKNLKNNTNNLEISIKSTIFALRRICIVT